MVSKNFSRDEFACKCGCGFAAVDLELLHVLEWLRSEFGSPVIINSACRCESHNQAAGGKPGSMHLRGMAADIVVKGVGPDFVANLLNGRYAGLYGVGKYDDFTHIDVREGYARWGF